MSLDIEVSNTSVELMENTVLKILVKLKFRKYKGQRRIGVVFVIKN